MDIQTLTHSHIQNIREHPKYVNHIFFRNLFVTPNDDDVYMSREKKDE